MIWSSGTTAPAGSVAMRTAADLLIDAGLTPINDQAIRRQCELGVVAWRRIDKPAVTGSIGIEEQRVVLEPTHDVARQVTDHDIDVVEIRARRGTQFGNRGIEFRQAIVVEGKDGTGQLGRHPPRFEPREQVTVQRVPRSQVGRQVPIVPAVVTADGDQVAPRLGPRDPRGDRPPRRGRSG